MKKYTVPIVLIVLFWSLPSEAQRTRRINSPSSQGCFRQSVSPLTYAPPLHTDMNLNTLLGYVYMDSLVRSETPHQIDSIASRITIGDTLKLFTKFLYAMTNYDPILFHEYSLTSPYVNSNYISSPASVVMSFTRQMSNLLGEKNKTEYIANSSLILHIQITNLWTSYDSLAKLRANPLPIQCVQAIIIDTLKGKHILTTNVNLSNKSGIQPQSTAQVIQFSFSPLWEKNSTSSEIRFSYDSTTHKSTLITENAYFNDTLHVGAEYIVVLNVTLLDYDGTNSYYNYRPALGYNNEGGIFPIVSGILKDSNNFWGAGVNPTYSNFIPYVKGLISNIANGN